MESPFRGPQDPGPLTEVLYRVEDQVAVITIDRPKNFNAYSTGALRELAGCFHAAGNDDRVGVIVFTGSGQRAFCTGGDVKEYEAVYTRRPHDYWKYMGLFAAYIESILNCGKPVVARLNGMAVGGGNESQLACDLSVMGNHAYIKQVGTQVGSVACGGSTQWLALFVGERRAREILLLNEPIPPAKCLEWGLVNEVVTTVRGPDGFVADPTEAELRLARKGVEGWSVDLAPLDEAVARWCAGLLRSFPECARYTKAQLNYWKKTAWHATVDHAREWLALHFVSGEPGEGMQAFVEKRPPDWAGIRAALAAGGTPEFPHGPNTMSCAACEAHNLPAALPYCGHCGAAL
ncbi:enoyl-CoA hydratase/isomerase family protein [bacterium]|nr:enoyl-CoA hydratase/isomerase family protein [bacterium]